MDAQGPGSPYQQTLQQEPRTNGATPTPCTISTSFHLSSRTIATPPPTTHPPRSYACMHVHTYTHACRILATSLFLVANPTHHPHLLPPPPPPPSHQAAEHTHLRGHTQLRTHLHTRCFSPRLSAAQSRQPPGMGEYYERRLIGRSL